MPDIRDGQQPELWRDLDLLIVTAYHRTGAFAEVNAAVCTNEPAGEECAQWRAFAGTLAGVASRAPRDAYIQTRVVHVFVSSGAYDLAIAVAQGCRAAEWLCRMLQGFAHSEGGQVVEAEGAFDEGLRGMPAPHRCAWTDLSALLSWDVWTAYRDSNCTERLGRLENLWDLVDPSWAAPGNDRKVEHYNRVAWAMLNFTGTIWPTPDRSGHGPREHREYWAEALRHGLHYHYGGLRWGRECRVEEYYPEFAGRGCPYTPDGQAYSVMPRDRALLDPLTAPADDWPLEPNWIRGGREAYIPRMGALLPSDAQVAFFERGDSLIATAATTVPEDAAFRDDLLQGAFLFLHADAETPRISAAGTARSGGWFFRATAPRRRYVVGIEAVAETAVGRARFGHGLPHNGDASLRLSDLLLYQSDGSPAPDSLEAALVLMKGDHRWSRAEALGVFLEVYGAEDAANLPVSVELERADGWLARLGAALGIGGDKPVNVQWSHTSAGDRFALSFTLDLAEIPAGDYAIRVSVGNAPGTTATFKAIQIVDGR